MPASKILMSLSSKKINSEKYFFELISLTFGNNFEPLPIKKICQYFHTATSRELEGGSPLCKNSTKNQEIS